MKAATDKLSLALRAVADPSRRKILRLLHPATLRKSTALRMAGPPPTSSSESSSPSRRSRTT